MEVQIISKKLITPSSPTSRHDLKISCLDQLAPPSYVQIIFYYDLGPESSDNLVERLSRLEASLSETLTFFYPLAGRYDENNMLIDCGDQGIEFLETRVNGELGRVLERPDPYVLRGFVDCGLRPSLTNPLLSVQVNLFECGGLAIGLSIAHVVADMYTFSLFVNALASVSKTGQTLIRPSFGLGSVFQQRDRPGFDLKARDLSKFDENKFVTRRFVFREDAMSRLKAKAKGRPSRVQVVTALMWWTLIKVCKAKHGHSRASTMVHALNLREKTKIPLPGTPCGNLWRPVLAKLPPSEDDEASASFEDIIVTVMDSMSSATSESSKPSLTVDDVYSTVRDGREEALRATFQDREVDVFDFTSWCKMGHYEVDFGWGRPSWVSSTHIPADGYFILMDSRDGVGVEAWVNLEEEKMVMFGQDPHIVSATV